MVEAAESEGLFSAVRADEREFLAALDDPDLREPKAAKSEGHLANSARRDREQQFVIFSAMEREFERVNGARLAPR